MFLGQWCMLIGHGTWAPENATAKHFRNQNFIRGSVQVAAPLPVKATVHVTVVANMHEW